MHALLTLTRANIRSFVRDRAALFWTIFFPVLFIVLFGTLFAGGGTPDFKVGWVDQDATPASAQLHTSFAEVSVLTLVDRGADLDAALDAMRSGDLDAVLVVPKGAGAAVTAAGAGGSPGATLTLYTDPSQSTTSATLAQIVEAVVSGTNQALSGHPPVLAVATKPVQGGSTQAGASYFVPSILAMALMQLGVFAAIPLVQQREKLILKRLGATPLPRWTLVGSNILMRLVIAGAQTAIILGIGIAFFGVDVTGSWPLIVGIVALGSLAFIAIGYVIASFARTEEAANGITQVVQVPMMFLSGIFFPIEIMPDWMKGIATFLPLTYLGDALRQTMVGGTPFVPLWVGIVILAGWLVVCFGIAARFFRWQ
ncbi:MAG TPA: ABC transporter permease [Candidatus Limnocylindrales bacterium]|jgi:ABC-2 type transport system permease protein|nr:ABC transporter permease [Candidatus Limnocylindrales bacterium]